VKINLFSFEWFPLLTTVILHDRISWSIRLRWLAISGFFVATLVVKYGFGLVIPYESIWLSLGILGLINVVYYIFLVTVKELSFVSELIVLHVHIIVDLAFLTLIIHYCGGVENPIYLFYVFHVVISSIMFPGLIPMFFATLVVLLFSGLIYLEYNGFITHYCVLNTGVHENEVAIYILLIIFIITVYISAYICMTFMQVYRNTKRQVDQQNKQLIETDKRKSSFFRYSSHELKSPIIAIKSSIDSILLSYSDVLDPRASNLMQRASARAAQMLEILKELLELSRNYTSRDEKTISKIDIHELLVETMAEEKPIAEQKQIEFKPVLTAKPSEIIGNRAALQQVFRNLINNAVQYSKNSGCIEIRTHTKDDKMCVIVKDNGIGIPKSDLSRVFDEFFRAPNARQKISFGTGLGLSLVKKIIEDHHGVVEVESIEGRGTTFTIYLPLDSNHGSN
jgi:signal transduction histidine kinase